jgi:hypothetical protein
MRDSLVGDEFVLKLAYASDSIKPPALAGGKV